jgi:hypothetical protein
MTKMKKPAAAGFFYGAGLLVQRPRYSLSKKVLTQWGR